LKTKLLRRHGGAGAAAYAASNMIKVLEETALWRLYVKGGASDIQILQDALSQAFLDIDSQLRVHQNRDDSKDFSGCTSVTAMITPKYIICANAGDSRCVLGTNNQAKAMSDDHKPNNPLEQNRIELAGGKVQWKRVDGDLAVSRGLGDFQFKARNDLGPSEQKVRVAILM
jgi:protein phosphatase PTC2/3